MKINTIHTVLFSPCGGTANATKALVRDVHLHSFEHDITLPANRIEKISFSSTDLVFFGFPVYGGRMPQNIKQVVTGLRGRDTPCVLVAVYGNRAFEGALLNLYEVATARPDKADRDRLAEFGLKILERAQNGATLEKAPGAYPDWKIPPGTYFFPITDTGKCIQCGHCVEVCPCGAIPPGDPAKTDIQSCISCAACVKYCPQKARTLGTPETREMFKPHIISAAATRKEAELFL